MARSSYFLIAALCGGIPLVFGIGMLILVKMKKLTKPQGRRRR